jgi:hypothetical protein
MTDLELISAHEALLAKALDFFGNDQNEDVCTLVYAFLVAQQNTFSANGLVASACLE